MRNQTPNLILECRNCRMKFQSKEQLSNHVAKFCKDSDYGSINRLQQKLEESKRSNKTANSATNIDELKSYFKGEYDVRNQNDIGSLSLEELRSKIRNNEREFEKVADHVLSAKEDDLRLDLLKLKYEKIESQAKRQYNETVFVDLMRELDSRMDREIRAQNERDQITLALRDLDRRNMGVGDAEKRRDLIRLENERDTLKNKEMEFLKDLENFKRWMQENERIWQAEKDRLNLETRGERVKINLELFQKRQMELAKERAMYINQMTEKRSGIELERQRIMDDLANLRKGDYGTIRKNSAGKLVGSSIVGTPVASSKFDNKALPAPVQRLNDKWQQDYEKLNNLKKEHQDYLQSNKSNPFDFRLEESRQNSLQNLNSPQYIQPATIRKPTQRTAIPSFGNNDLAPINNYIPMQPPLNNFPYNPMMPPQMLNPYQMNYGYNNPFALSLHQPPPQEDKANLALKKELKKIKKKLKNKDEDNFYVGMQNAIGVFQNKINDLERPNHPNQAISSEDLLPEERALNNVLNQEQADLKLLSALPRDSELYRAKMDHYKEMSQIRMRMEGMLQELSMQRMKKNFEREMENKERKLVNEK